MHVGVGPRRPLPKSLWGEILCRDRACPCPNSDADSRPDKKWISLRSTRAVPTSTTPDSIYHFYELSNSPYVSALTRQGFLARSGDLSGTMHIFRQLYSQTPDQNLL